MKKRSVGLLVMTEVAGVLYAVLQRRGEFNFENGKPESWANTCQPTIHGRINVGDEFEKVALWREGFQEGGPNFTEAIMELPFEGLHTTEIETEVIKTWVVKAPLEVVKSIRLGPSSGGLRFLNAANLHNLLVIEDLDSSVVSKAGGLRLNHITAMFRHNAESVRKAFEVFGSPQPQP